MTDLEYVVEKLKDRNCTAVAKAVSVSSKTVREIASGKNKNPSYATVHALMVYLMDRKTKKLAPPAEGDTK